MFGRHGGIGEKELNVNNLKKLKNVKIESLNIDKAIKNKKALDRTAKFNARYPQMKCSVGYEIVKGKYQVINIENNLENVTDDDCNLLCKNWFKKIVKSITNDTYETYYEVMNTEDKMNLLDSDFRLMLHDWYYSILRLKDSDLALVTKTPITANRKDSKCNIINLRTQEEVVPEDFVRMCKSMYMNNHAYAVIAVEPEHECIVNLYTGKYMTDAMYCDVETTYKNGIVMQRIDGTYDIFDSNCRTIIDKVDKQISYGSNLLKVSKNNMVNVVNMATGKVIIPKWVPEEMQLDIVTLNDTVGTFNHKKPGIYIKRQKFDDFGNIASVEQIYVDFNGNAQIFEENPFED